MLRLFFPAILFTFCLLGISQDSEKSPNQMVTVKPASLQKIDTLNNQAFELIKSDINQALKQTNECLELAEKLQYTKGIGFAYQNLGYIFKRKQQDVQALGYFQKASILFKKSGFKTGESECYVNMGRIHYKNGDFKSSIHYLEMTLELERETGNKVKEAKALNNLGIVFKNSKNYERALSLFSQSLEINQVLKRRQSEAKCYNNIGSVYLELEDTERAIVYYKKSLEIKEQIDDRAGMGISYGNLADLHNQLGESLTDLEKKETAIAEAIRLANQSLALATEFENLSSENFAYGYLTDSYQQLGDYKNALKYNELLFDSHNRLYNAEKNRAIIELEAQFQNKTMEKENQLLNEKKDSLHQKLKLEKKFRYALAILSFIILAFLIHIFSSRWKLRIRNSQLNHLNQKIKSNSKIIAESESRFRRVFDDSNDAFFWTDPKQRTILNCNQGAEILLGVPREELMGKRADSFFPENMREQFNSEIDEAMNQTGLSNRRFLVVTNTGDIKHVSISISESIIDGQLLRQSVVRDITSSVRVELALKRGEQELKALTRTLVEQRNIFMVGNVVIFKWHNKVGWPVEYVSENVVNVLGYSMEECLTQGFLFSDLLDLKARTSIESRIKASIQNGENFMEYSELQIKKKNGQKAWFYIFTTVQRNEIGEVTHFFGYLMDITARKEADSALVISEANLKESNRTKDLFFSIIAHDLKNPFSTILGFCDLLLTNFDSYDDARKKMFIETIQESSQGTFKLLENLLIWSRSQRGLLRYNPNVENLYLLWSDTLLLLKEMAQSKNITVTETLQKNINITVDKDLIGIVFRNLLSNAIKFSPKGSQITVSAEISPTEEGYIICHIEDAGVGISSEVIDNLFALEEKFSTPGTENETGTGLGLILCNDFIAKHGGHIWVESELDKGSRFSFTLKLA